MGIKKQSIFLLLISLLNCEPIEIEKWHYRNWPNTRDHPGHSPFCSFFTYRTICDHIIDQSTERFDPDSVQEGDIIYLNIWYLDWFAAQVHDKIRHPYILVTCDVGNWVPVTSAKKLLYDPKLAAWFSKNILFSHHPKIAQLPMGQDFGIFDLNPQVSKSLLEAVKRVPYEKKHLLYMCHRPRPHGDRDKIVPLFENQSYCYTRNKSSEEWKPIDRALFYEEMGSSLFVLSPLGLETDCVRTWEAFVLGCIPIVEHTFNDPIYEGLPVVMVHNWEEIDLPFLMQKYEALKSFQCDKAYFGYWRDRIQEVQRQVRAKNCSFSKLEATQFLTSDLEDLISILEEKGGKNLVYAGFLSAIRSLQLAKIPYFLQKIFLYDPWMDQETLFRLPTYLEDLALFENADKLTLVRSHFEISTHKDCSFFIDLSYYRHSLFPDFKTFRHALKEHLSELYQWLGSGTLLCGNRVFDPYVKEVLEKFSAEYHLSVEKRGNFWYLIK